MFLDKYTNINNDILQTDIENSLTDVSLKGINRQLHIQVDRQMKDRFKDKKNRLYIRINRMTDRQTNRNRNYTNF